MKSVLYDRQAQRTTVADFVPMTEDLLRRANSSWITSFQQRYQAQEQDDDAWMWNGNQIVDLLTGRAELRLFGLVVNERIMGVLFLQNASQPARIDPSLHLLYVQYIATAPWNRREKNQAGRLRGVGTSLMAWAKTLSQEAGCGGRLGLHSLRSSDSFYHQMGLHSFGLDPAHRGMNYFELCDSGAMQHFDDVCNAPTGIGSV